MQFIKVTLLVCLYYVSSIQGGTQNIVRGNDASVEEFPYAVSISDDRRKHACNGAIVSNLWVVTSASCVTTKKCSPKKRYVTAGVSSINNRYTKAQVRRVRKMVVSNDGSNTDIAVVKVVAKFKFSNRVLPITLPSIDFVVPNEAELIVLSFGSYDNLQKLKLKKTESCEVKEKESATSTTAPMSSPATESSTALMSSPATKSTTAEISTKPPTRTSPTIPTQPMTTSPTADSVNVTQTTVGRIIKKSANDAQICALSVSSTERQHLCEKDVGGAVVYGRYLVGIVKNNDCKEDTKREKPYAFADVTKFINFIKNHM